jgi:O-antigen/teichoic acid export membrane protein
MISGQGIAVLFQAAYFVLIGRTLGSKEYGAFVGVVSLVTVLSNFSTLGMEMILVRNISRERDSFASTWGSALLVTGGGFVALLVVAMAFGHFVLPPELRILVPYIALSDGLLGKVTQLAGRAFQGAGQLAYMAKLTVLTNAGRAAMAAALFFYARSSGSHPSAYTWTKIYWLSTLAIGIISFVLVTVHLGWPKFRRLSLHDLFEGVSFSLSTSSISVYNDIDKTFLVSAGQLYAVGIYTAAYRVIDVASIPIYSIYAAATPRMFRQGVSGVHQAKRMSRGLLMKTLPYGAAATIGIFLGASWFPFVFGSSFRGSVEVLRWLCLLPFIRVLHYSWGTTITASASQWNRTATQLGAAGLNLVLNAILIPRWSWHGAAIASLLTDGALAASSRVVLWRLERREGMEKQTVSDR